ncbi:glutathione S-transferase [Aspergillus pseudoustus]|uniref:Glutathione S-transferase n=1 Tax=Aspergillus pseudoustus TaxID=1810923 RepID=A0ABR4JJ31_9EURO
MGDITLYTCSTPNGIKVSIALEELSLAYRVVPIDISSGAQKEPSFLAINPNGRIPAITDFGLRVFESGAILQYLAETYDRDRTISYAPGTPEYWEQMSWLMFQMGGVGPMQGQANHFRLFAGEYSAYGIQRYTAETKRLYSVLNDRLTVSPYLAGPKYTIADIANFGWVRYAPLALEINLNEFPALKRWHSVILERSAVQRGLAVPTPKSDAEIAERYRGLREKVDGLRSRA